MKCLAQHCGRCFAGELCVPVLGTKFKAEAQCFLAVLLRCQNNCWTIFCRMFRASLEAGRFGRTYAVAVKLEHAISILGSKARDAISLCHCPPIDRSRSLCVCVLLESVWQKLNNIAAAVAVALTAKPVTSAGDFNPKCGFLCDSIMSTSGQNVPTSCCCSFLLLCTASCH